MCSQDTNIVFHILLPIVKKLAHPGCEHSNKNKNRKTSLLFLPVFIFLPMVDMFILIGYNNHEFIHCIHNNGKFENLKFYKLPVNKFQ
jgi:hypothetical protein